MYKFFSIWSALQLPGTRIYVAALPQKDRLCKPPERQFHIKLAIFVSSLELTVWQKRSTLFSKYLVNNLCHSWGKAWLKWPSQAKYVDGMTSTYTALTWTLYVSIVWAFFLGTPCSLLFARGPCGFPPRKKCLYESTTEASRGVCEGLPAKRGPTKATPRQKSSEHCIIRAIYFLISSMV